MFVFAMNKVKSLLILRDRHGTFNRQGSFNYDVHHEQADDNCWQYLFVMQAIKYTIIMPTVSVCIYIINKIYLIKYIKFYNLHIKRIFFD